MISTLVDSNIILDLLSDDPRWASWSASQLEQSRESGRVLINPLIYAECSPRFDERPAFDRILDGNALVREDLPWDAAHLAGWTHGRYRKSGGVRDRVLPDFFIGAHASVRGYRLLTRDAGRYRSYFPELDIIAPDTAA